MIIHSKIGEQGELIIHLVGNVDFNHYKEFTEAYQKFDQVFKKYIVDLSETKSIDNSALGMFLLLRDFAGGDSAEVSLMNPNPLVREFLETSKFNKIFNII
jgi:anti-anti-sigma factor